MTCTEQCWEKITQGLYCYSFLPQEPQICNKLEAANSTPGSSKLNPGSSKLNPRQQQSQLPAATDLTNAMCCYFSALFSALCSVHCCTAHCIASAVQCRLGPKMQLYLFICYISLSDIYDTIVNHKKIRFYWQFSKTITKLAMELTNNDKKNQVILTI